MSKKSEYICITCNTKNIGGKTRIVCPNCVDIPRYCKCGCDTKLTYIYSSVGSTNQYTWGHNVYQEDKSLRIERGKNGYKKSIKNRQEHSEFICKNCNEIKIGYKGSKTCKDCLNSLVPCSCGCGGLTKFSRKTNTPYIYGHHLRTEETRKLNSERTKQLHKNGLYLNNYGNINKSSKIELSLKPYLEPLGYLSTQDKQYHIGKTVDRIRIPDYVNYSERKIIEVWGRYWHRDENPQEMIDWYTSYGWNCITLWEDEVKDFINNLTSLAVS